MVLLDEPLALGSVVEVELAAVIEATQESEGETTRNDRLVGVVPEAHGSLRTRPLQPSAKILDGIQKFFVAYNRMQRRKFLPLARKGPEGARALLAQGMARWRGRHRASRERPRPTRTARSTSRASR